MEPVCRKKNTDVFETDEKTPPSIKIQQMQNKTGTIFHLASGQRSQRLMR
jgi:hypothetical protein